MTTMYYTVQIKLRTDEEQHEILQQYEYIYLSELQRLITKMVNLKKKQRFSSFQYSPCIEKSCRWMLYIVATKIATAKIENRTGTYNKSGTWSTNAFKIIHNDLFLSCGEGFPCKEIIIPLAMNSKIERRLNKGKKMRLDLVHDENLWYCNILMQAEDQ